MFKSHIQILFKEVDCYSASLFFIFSLHFTKTGSGGSSAQLTAKEIVSSVLAHGSSSMGEAVVITLATVT